MTSVIINDVTPRTQIIVVGSQTVFSTNWTAEDAEDVIVYQRAGTAFPDDFADKLPTNAYTVAFVGIGDTVEVTLITPASDGDVVTITRATPVDRLNLYTNLNYTSSMLNQDFGLLTLMIQESDMYETQLTPKYPQSADINDFDIILPLLGPGESWVMNSNGDEIIAAVAGGSAADILAQLASHAVGEGASLIGLQGTGTVQDLANAQFIVQTANAATPNAQALGDLTTGILKSTTSTGVLSISAPLTSIDGLTTATDKMIYTTAPNVYAVTDLTPFARTLLDDTTAAAAAVTLAVLPLSGGTMTGTIDMGSNYITNLLDPVNAQDAATKNYVQNSLAMGFLPTTGGTMSGQINMGNNKIVNMADPSLAQDAVTLSYLNTALTDYLQKSGGTMTGPINMGSNKITNVTDPTNAQDAATKAYVDSVATGLAVQPACRLATTGALTVTYANGASGIGATLTNAGAMAALSLDGVAAATNDRVLIKDQASLLQNGIYTVTNIGSGAVNWVLTRATDYDQPSEIQPGDLVIINEGSTYAGTSFIQTDSVSAVGTDAIEFSQFTFSASAVLLKANNLSDVASTVSSFNNISPTTTKGDLIVDNGTDDVRLAVGANSTLLQANSGASTGLQYTTATYPTTTTVNQILYSNATNTITGLATTVGGVLVTDNTGVPQFLTNPSAANRILLSGSSAIPSWSTYTMPSSVSTSGKVVVSDGTNLVMSTPTFPNASATSRKMIVSDGTNWVPSTETWAVPGANGTILQSNGTNWVSTTATYAAPGTSGNVMTSDGTNWTSAPPAASNLLTTKGDLFGFSTVNARVPVATGNGKILQVDSTASVGLSYSTPTYPSASGTSRKILVSDGTNNVYSTETWAVPGTSGNILKSDGTNWTSAAPGVTFSYVKQVVQTVDTTNRSTTSASYVTSNISVSITPSSNTNRVRLSFYGLAGHSTSAVISEYTLYRDSTPLTPSGVNSMAATYIPSSNAVYVMFSIDFIDSPATTSAITYALYFRTSGGTTYLGRRGLDTSIDNCCVLTAEELSA